MAAQPLKVFHLQRHAHAAGNGQQMHNQVGRAPHGGVDHNGVLKSLTRQNFGKAQILTHHLYNAVAGQVGQPLAPRICRRNGRAAGHGEPQCFDHAGHGGSRAHGHAGAVAARHARFSVAQVFGAHDAGAEVVDKAPHIGAGANVFAAEFAVEHGAAGDHNGGQIHAGRAHERGRGGLIAAGEQHHTI